PLRAACAVRVAVEPPGESELLEWGRRRLAAAGAEAEPGTLEALLETCEHDALAFLNEVGKLAVLGGREGRVSRAHVQALAAPRVGAEIVGFLMVVASGDPAVAAQRLERLLAAGESEGSVLWALGNLVAGSLGGWSRWKD